MSATIGYFVAGSSWLHRRNPLTKLLALALILLSAFLLPPVFLVGLIVVIVAALWSAGLLRPTARAMRIPALLFLSILVVNSLFYPGVMDKLVTVGPLSISREGLTFGLISAGRILAAFLASVAFLFTTLADDLLETLIARGASHRISFVILSAVQMVPRMQERAGSILEAQQARGLSLDARSCGVSARSSRWSGRSCSGPSSMPGSGPSHSRRAASARGQDGPPTVSSPTRPSTGGSGS